MEISAGIELIIYFAVFIGAQLYSLVQFSLQSQDQEFLSSADLLGNLLLEYPDDFSVDCITSWKLPLVSWTCHQPVDISDDEWRVAREFLFSTKVAYLVGHCLGWAIHLPHFTILYSLLCLFRILGPGPLLLIAANICLSFILTFILQHQNLFPSSSSLPSSVLLHYLLFTVCLVANNLYHADLHNFEVNLLFNLSVSWLNAKLLSAALDSHSKEQKELLLLQKLTYLLYYPSFFFGPIFHFEDFARALSNVENRNTRPLKIRLLLRTFFWALVFDLLLKRLLYSSAFLNYPQYLNSSSNTISAWALAGFGFSLMLLFFLKYRVLYGVSKAVAEEVDGLNSNKVFAQPPQCIAHMATTAYLWRHFDQGLYAFLFRYFYAPLTGGKGAPLWRRALASSVCFAAIAAWHEQLTSPSIAVWVALNFVLLNVEQAGRFLKGRLLKSSNLP
ncbi:hypothetical protein TYRP_015324 [Tyrophagus putrescentiae]|nr:hypothetical protein TYRP_015324 [Tyrophagus putrescentiae]